MKIFKIAVFLLYFSPEILHAKNTMEFSAIENSSYATISERVLKVAYSRLGIEMVVKNLPAQRAIHEANTGIVDGELYRIKNVHLKYKNLIMIPIPIGIMEGIAITRQIKPPISGWEDLSPYRICIRNGVKFAEAGTRQFEVRAVNSNRQLFGMLGKDRCDAIIIARLTSIPLALDFIKKQKIQIHQSLLQVYPLYHYVHKKNVKLVPKLIEVLKNMQEEGIISKIRSQYISEISRQE